MHSYSHKIPLLPSVHSKSAEEDSAIGCQHSCADYLCGEGESGFDSGEGEARGGLKVDIQIFSYRLAKPSKPIFFPKVEKSDAN